MIEKASRVSQHATPATKPREVLRSLVGHNSQRRRDTRLAYEANVIQGPVTDA